MSRSRIQVFADSVEVQDDGCWLWTAVKTPSGYGNFWDGTKTVRAHRWGYEYFVGPIPVGLHLDHLCVNPSCVCPEHLEPVTQHENGRRSFERNLSATHCKNGHRFTPKNTRLTTNSRGNPQRRCRACDRDSNLRHRARHRGETATGEGMGSFSVA